MTQKGPRILVVDDDELVSEMLGDILLDAGFVVTTASSVDEALEAATRRDIDVVLTDVNLKNSSGFELLEHLRGRSPSTPAILLTAFLDDETEDLANELGAYAAIAKPFHNGDLVALVRRALANPVAGSTVSGNEAWAAPCPSPSSAKRRAARAPYRDED
jgi:two-component system NtrC family response regulator